MKKILVIGASGNIGLNVIKYLLCESKYEITALDLRNNKTHNNLKKYRKKINIVYGDMNDHILMDNLVVGQDFIIVTAGVIPPLSELKTNLMKNVEYDGLKNIIRAINAYNKEVNLIYTSSTSIYGLQPKGAKVNTRLLNDPTDQYNTIKINIEKMIKKNINNYLICRLPLVLGDFVNDFPIYNIKCNYNFDTITAKDAAYGIVSSISKYKNLNKKIVNMTGGPSMVTNLKQYYYNVLSTYGLSFRYLISRFMVPKNFYGNVCNDSEELNDLLNYRSESTESYVIRIKRTKMYNRRIINRLLAKPFLPRIK